MAAGYARRIARDIQSLVDPALCIGSGGLAPAAGSHAIKETGEVAAALMQASDLLQRRHGELQESERRYSALFANKINGMAHCRVITDDLGRPVDYWILEVNEAYQQILGIQKADIEGRRVSEVFPGFENSAFDYIGVLGKVALEGGEIHSEAFLEHSRQFLSVYAYSPHPGEFTVFLSDVTERKLMEAQLRASEAHYRLLTENVSDIVWKLDPDYRFTYISPADERLRGYRADEVIGRTLFELTTDEGVSLLKQKLRGSREELPEWTGAGTLTIELQQRCRDGRLIWTEVLSTPERDGQGGIAGYHGITRDITERKQAAKLERKLLHAQKLESLGVLAGGIAHDFNNILMAILGNAELAMMCLPEESPVLENLRRIEQAGTRASHLTKQMLAYSGKGRFVIENLDLNGVLERMRHMLELTASKKAALRLSLQRSLPSVEADASQLQQIVMNLVTNAAEAMGDENGVISIATGCLECDRNYLSDVWLDENVSEGLYVYLEVADTGCGMDQKTMAKLFDPFFTTKFTGRGLGMAAVQGIVKGHRGSVKVSSEPGQGSTVTILLPAIGRSSDRPVPVDLGKGQTDAWRGSGTVLLVDDEETVRGIGSAMLRALGFTPITANDGVEAIGLFQQTADIALVILDLTMPRMDGEKCFRELRQLDPLVKVVMSSGYNEQEVTGKFTGEGLSGFIQKPYRQSELRDAIMMVV